MTDNQYSKELFSSEEKETFEEIELKPEDLTAEHLEAILATSCEPIDVKTFATKLEIDPEIIENKLYELKQILEERNAGTVLKNTEYGWVLKVNLDYSVALDKFFRNEKNEKLSYPAYEVLTIIAYKQPITRGEITTFRGVNSDRIVKNLQDKGLVEFAGKDAISGAITYRTTKFFLDKFNLESLDDLPEFAENIEEIKSEPILDSQNVSLKKYLLEGEKANAKGEGK